MQEPAAALRCSHGAGCVAYPILGVPAKLSRSNPGPSCFACEERRAAAELEAVVADEQRRKATGSPKANRSRPGKGNKPKERTCMKQSCERPVAERDGTAVVCREHAAVSRAAAVRERRGAWVLACERAVRSAITSGDERLERRWARLLLAAEVSFADAEAELRVAEMRARSAPATRWAERIPKTGY
ncbi:MAG: hypothetical protein LC714_05695 [Actinobacteria bacterium]|nr:hypothetical protein [Actinomycetota bacterium]